MKSGPLVSIIMNCFNGERFLNAAIDSIYSQTYSNWEIIFWDNCSTDNSALIAQSYNKKLKYYLSSQMTPLGEARNLAVKKVTGKYIAFLDCDDLYESEKLQKQVSLMEGDDFVYCYGSAIIINEKGREIGRQVINNKGGNIFGNLLKKYDVNMQSVMIKKSALNEIFFNTSLMFSPDYNLFMGLASIGKVGIISDYIVTYRKTNNSLTLNSTSRIYKEKKYTLDNLFSNNRLSKKYTKEFKCAYRMLNYSKAIYYIGEDDYNNARIAFKEIVGVKFKYRVFYYLLYFPISKKTLLKKLLGY
jgi:glycosyltransferase involved in cell wall biosynthesis